MTRTFRSLRRLFQIARILARHDALFVLQGIRPVVWCARLTARCRDRTLQDKRPGERLSLALQQMGPTFIKLGQVLATRSDLIGAELARDLAQLQDRLPPFPFAAAKDIIEQDLGQPLGNLFAYIDETPVAAASIAQVHRATTRDGRKVAVKVTRPDVGAAFRRDLELFHWLAERINNNLPRYRRLKFREVVDVLESTIATEMDLRMEAAAAVELAENFRNDPELYIPAIDWNRTGPRVLTLEWVDGLRIDDRAALEQAGHNVDGILQRAANAFFKQVYRDGYFHADMHPGNLFIIPDGRIAVIDFGIMGRLDRQTRFYLADMLHGFLTGNYRRIAEIHFEAGYVPAHKSVDLFAQACRSIGQPLLNRPLEEISLANLLAQMFAVTEAFEMPTQPQLLMLQKSMVVTEGIGRTLDPHVNMWELSRPLVEAWAIENRGPIGRLRNLAGEIERNLARLPRFLDDVESLVHDVRTHGLPLRPAGGGLPIQSAQRTPPVLWVIAGLLLLLAVLQVME